MFYYILLFFFSGASEKSFNVVSSDAGKNGFHYTLPHHSIMFVIS